MKKELIVDLIIFLFIILFMYASVSKLIDYNRFIIQIQESPIFNRHGSHLAIFIPIVEIIVSLFLAIPNKSKYGLYGSFILMLTFTSYVLYVLKFGNHTHCTCGGVFQQMTWHSHLVFNLVFLLLSIIGIVLKSGSRRFERNKSDSNYCLNIFNKKRFV